MGRSDDSQGWEAIAEQCLHDLERSTIGVATVGAWARSLPAGATVLDLGCGPGGPRSQALHDVGLTVYAIDAAPSLADAYRRRFPAARVACENAVTSPLFDREFDAALAWGLVFLLPEADQIRLLQQVARTLRPGGRLLFTAPRQPCTWADLSTGRPSRSLGAVAYEAALAAAGSSVRATWQDEGENHYFDVVRH